MIRAREVCHHRSRAQYSERVRLCFPELDAVKVIGLRIFLVVCCFDLALHESRSSITESLRKDSETIQRNCAIVREQNDLQTYFP
jgi:hypothetical protein